MKRRLSLTLSAFCFLVMGQLAYGSYDYNDSKRECQQSIYPKLLATTPESTALPMNEVLVQKDEDMVIDSNEQLQVSAAWFSNRTKTKLKVVGTVLSLGILGWVVGYAFYSCHQYALSMNSTAWCLTTGDDGYYYLPPPGGLGRNHKL